LTTTSIAIKSSISKKEEDFEFKRHEYSIEKKNSSEVEKLLFLPCTCIQITPPFLMNIRLNEKFILTFLIQVQGYIFELMQMNFSNALDFEKFMHKAGLDMVQLN
jgi:hypothetical protein